MTRLFTSGFETGDLGEFEIVGSGTPTLQTGTNPRTGNYCARFNSNGLRVSVPDRYEIYFGSAYFIESTATVARRIFSFLMVRHNYSLLVPAQMPQTIR
jgi:hypothetical protein